MVKQRTHNSSNIGSTPFRPITCNRRNDMNKQAFSLTHLKLRVSEEVENTIQDFELQEKSCAQNEVLVRYVIATEVATVIDAWKGRAKKALETAYATFIEAVPVATKQVEADKNLLLVVSKSKEVVMVKADLLIVALQSRVGQKITHKLIDEITKDATSIGAPRLSIKIEQAFL